MEAVTLDAGEPDEITTEQFDDLMSTLLQAVMHCRANPLTALSTDQHRQLTNMAYHKDELNLGILEAAVRNAILERNDSEATANRFNLGMYRKQGKTQREAVREAKELAARLAMRKEACPRPRA